MHSFPAKHFEEKMTIEFSFLEDLIVEDIVTAKVYIDVAYGWDNSPGLVLLAEPVIDGPVVFQEIGGGEPFTMYRLTCQVETTGDRTLVIQSFLPISGYRSLYSQEFTPAP